MVSFKYSSESLLKNPEKSLQQFSIDIFVQREMILSKLKDKRVKVLLKDDKIRDCIFINADLTHFTYKLLDETKSRKTLLRNLILRSTN